jgi:hypothetical protein
MYMGSNAAESDGFLRAIKISRMTCFRVEVKLSAPCYKILWPKYAEYDKRYFASKITGHFSPSFSMLHY